MRLFQSCYSLPSLSPPSGSSSSRLFFLCRRHFSSREAEAVAGRIHMLQDVYEMSLPANQPYVMRLDGVSFRNYTLGMMKPFDPRFTKAMLLTTRDLMERCAARTAFCQSDEISLVFAPEPSPLQIIYAGRIQKIVSVMASWAAARFNWHISRMGWSDPDVEKAVKERVEASVAVFDARIFSVPDDMMAAEAIYWRHRYDGRRNAVNMVGCQHYDQQKLHGMGLGELTSRLKKDHNIDPMKDFPPSAIYGAFLKKKTFPHMGYNPITGQSVPTLRAKVEARSFDWIMDDVQRAEMTMARLWTNDHPASLEVIDLGHDIL